MARDRVVKVVLKLDVDDYVQKALAASAATDALADKGIRASGSNQKLETSSKGAAQGAAQMDVAVRKAATATAALDKSSLAAAESSLRLLSAQNSQTDAANKVSAAEKVLASARKSGDTAKIAAAETSLAKSRRDLEVVTLRYSVAAGKAAENERKLGASMQGAKKLSDQTALSFGNLVMIAATVGPALVPIGGGAAAIAVGLGGMGIAGVLAFKGIADEMESGSALGVKYTDAVAGVDDTLTALKRTAAEGVLDPFLRTVGELERRTPELDATVMGLSRSTGLVGESLSTGLLNILQDLDPLMQSTLRRAVELADGFQRFTEGDGVSKFAAFAQENLPATERLLAELATTLGHVIQAAAPLGGPTLAAITGISAGINAIPLPVLTAMITLATQGGLAWKAWKGVSGILSGVSSAFDRTGAAAQRMDGKVDKAQTKLGRFGKIGGAAASIALIGASAATSGNDLENFGRSSSTLEGDILGLAKGGNDLGFVFQDLQIKMAPDKTFEFAEGMRATKDGATDLAGEMLSLGGAIGSGATPMDAARARLKAIGVELAEMVNTGRSDEAKVVFDKIAAGAAKAGISTAELTKMMPGYADALQDIANKQKIAGASADGATGPTSNLADALDDMGKEGKDAELSLESLGEAITGLIDKQTGQRDAAVDWADSQRDVVEALKKSKGSVDAMSESGGKAVKAQNSMAKSGLAVIDTMLQNGATAEQVRTKYLSLRDAFIRANSSMDGGRDAATALADQLGYSIPDIATAASKVRDLKPAADAASAGMSGMTLTMNNIGEIVATLNGKTITIPADVPNGERTATVLLGLRNSVLSFDGKEVAIPTSTLGVEGTKAALTGIEGARQNADGTVSIPTSALNAQATQLLLNNVATAATTADGKTVVIPATSPQAIGVARNLDGISAAALSADAKSVNITTIAPLSAGVRAELGKLAGVAVTTDGKSVTIDTSAPGAIAAAGQVRAALNAAQSKTITITTIYKAQGDKSERMISGNPNRAIGGVAYPGYGGTVPGYATGGEVFDALRGGRVRGPGSRTSDSILAMGAMGQYALSDYEHVWTGNEVDAGGGHGTQYMMRELARQGRLQKVVKAGMLAGFAGGGSTGMEGWDPDLSAIISLTGSLRVDATTVAESQTKAKTTADALAKATRDLKAARARSAGLSSKASAATKISAANALTTALEKQAKAQAAATSAERTYQSQKKASTSSSAALFLQATGTTNSGMQAFLDDIDTIRRKGQPKLALSLLQDGSEDSRKTAHDLARGSKSQLLNAASGLATSDRLQDRKDATLKALTGSPTASYEERTKANAAALALRGATNAAYNNAGPSVRASFASEFAAMAKAITIQPGRVDMHLDGRVIGQVTTNFQSTEAGYGSTTPGVEKQ